jgi:hypothetical protein
LATGVLIGLVYLAVAAGARFAVGFVNSFARSSGYGLTITSNLFDFVNGNLFLVLVVALIVVKIAHRAVKSPVIVKGPLKVALGGLSGVFYYLTLTGGILTFTVGLQKPASGSLVVAISLVITLVLLEVSAIMKMLQGVFEYRDVRREAIVGPAAARTRGSPALSIPAP